MRNFSFWWSSSYWCSRERVQIQRQSKIFSPANLRTARHELPGYGDLIDYWLDNRYTLRFCGGLVPDMRVHRDPTAQRPCSAPLG